ncbi:globin domain-containing protein [uncultured Corynebacterium sp.]|uniref:globin domain-containing protein n=1 Tax=uncultured Corynebacterium sp. TaxID=159447 RepID=UPI0025D4C764|nr:globin domain-containing protein [uncultured Corynebacterium sp.]
MATIDVKKTGLTDEQADIIRQTLPVVGANIGDITPNFYRRMFEAHPELIADTFNRGNQKQGAQQKALAASVATFAATLVDPDAPAPAELLSRIGHKHLSVGIVEEQYPIVHEHLFDAIEEVLTPGVFQGTVRDAWDAVYLEMQRVLVEFEKELYDETGVAPGDVFRATEVVSRDERGDVVVFGVRGKDGELPGFTPGQYISVRQTMADGARQLRQYSLVGVPGDGVLKFAVRRVGADDGAGLPAGEVSNQLCSDVRVGDDLEISLPAGDLVLDTDSEGPVVLVSAGIGATPMVGMLSYLAANGSGRRVLSVHADRSPEADVLAVDRTDAVDVLTNGSEKVWYEPEFMDLSTAGGVDLPDGAEYYLCGGNGFLQRVRDQLAERGIDRGRVHFELFSPNAWLLDA